MPYLGGPAGDVAIDTLSLRDLAPGPGWHRPLLLDRDLLALVTGGHGTVELDFRPLRCRPGTLLRVRAGQVLRCPVPPLDATVVRWAPAALHGLDVDLDAVAPWRQLAGEDADAVISEVTQLAVDCQRHRDVPAAQGLLRHQLAVLLLRLTLLPGGAPPAAPRAEAATFDRFRREVERGYPHTRRVEDYAARLGCSVRTLTRACLAVTGRSAKQVVDERVALQASRLLAASDEPIARIGRSLGFTEPTNFGRFFTREVGASPGAFRAAREQPLPGSGRPPAAQPSPGSGQPADGPTAPGGRPTAPPGPPQPPNGRVVRPRPPADVDGASRQA
ncbi:AraC family transcriptional regulator [Micromonospora endolithica]|uniref:AraC family transcriptional regulator n=2 Tax=Micromonospora endolithica TaxID=230091 RepID=A0A3A9YR34_9ACTN|nr:AraC family transcriptional regulator [Micromonospora endolithica]RKN38430.1 AraC family transcriptional regulator [Micromonospora endolithica]TWJ23154.1 transcriptional regulator, AraC family [Micromonospora endolithica]